MKRIRFLMIGGFLGAGKTTAIARLARHYIGSGLNVGLVTNDQAYDLVDTHALRAQGFRVGEVPGACFCCQFDELVATTRGLAKDDYPDVIITEPVGSCTDLVSTVIEPLRHLHRDQFELAPLVVLLKPEHGRKILEAGQGAGFSPKAEYIFMKQLEEADVVVINKIDKLSLDEREHLVQLVSQRFPDQRTIAASAMTGEGFEILQEQLECTGSPRTTPVDVDYDIYAEGEAELGWLNSTVQISTTREAESFGLDEVLLELVTRLREALKEVAAEPAHLKVLGMAQGATGVANLVGSDVDVQLSLASHVNPVAAELLVNARVAYDPQRLAQIVDQVIADLGRQHGFTHRVQKIQCFRPARPVPTHRFLE